MNLPTFDDAGDAAEPVANHGRALIPWLPDPQQCPECGALMLADVTFDPHFVEHTPCWSCPECGTETYRDEPFDISIAPPRRGGADRIVEAMTPDE